MSNIIFLQQNSQLNHTISKGINIILSCEFYWVRVFEIPVKSKKEALLVVPNMFEEFFDINGYEFYIIKQEDNKYLSFAYNPTLIKNELKKQNIPLKYINQIYFANNEFTNETIFKFNDIIYYYENNILVKVPTSLNINQDIKEIDLTNITLSKEYIILSSSSKYITTKTAYILSGLFLLFSLSFGIKTFLLIKEQNKILTLQDKLKNKYHLPNSIIQTKSILKQFNKASKKYNSLRDILAYTINIKQYTNAVLHSIEYNNQRLKLSYKKTTKDNIKKYISKKYKIESISQNNDIVKVEIKI